MDLWPLYRDTLQGLAAPRRSVPIALLAVPLLVAQRQFSYDPRGDWLGVGMIVALLGLGPFTWRAFVSRRAGRPWPTRLAGFAVVAGLPFVVAFAAPRVLGLDWTFLTGGVHSFVTSGLFWVGSWGLARDLELEASFFDASRRAELAEAEAERAQLMAVRAHLDPHFLFNTLNAIAEWCTEDPKVAERALLDLSRLLREVMTGVRAPSWPLSREIAVLEQVLDLYTVRDPSRFTARWDVDEAALDAEIPPLLLLPLVENAIKHGPAAGHDGPVGVTVRADGDVVRIVVENPGAFRGPREGGEGLAMVTRRFALAYGDDGGVEVTGHGDRTVARAHLPRRLPGRTS